MKKTIRMIVMIGFFGAMFILWKGTPTASQVMATASANEITHQNCDSAEFLNNYYS